MTFTSRLAFYALCLTVATATPSFGQTPGADWLATSKESRQHFVFGFQQGAMATLAIQGVLDKRLHFDEFGVLRAELSPEQTRILAKSLDDLREQAGGRFGVEPVCDVITALYQDPANAMIKWPAMVPVATMKLSGRAQAEVQKELEALRRASAPGGG